MTQFTLLLSTLEVFARAGGGGSSSGGGGGGGEVIALLGYFPSYYLGKLIKKLLPRRAELIVSASFATVVSIALLVFGTLLGFIGTYFAVLIIIGIWMGWAAAFFGVWERLGKYIKKARQTIATASKTDPSWNEQALHDYAKQTFVRYQQDWSTFNLESIITYATQDYAQHTGLLLQALREMGRTNRVSNVEIIQCAIIHAVDDTMPSNRDYFVVAFEAKATDELIDSNGQVLYTDKRSFVENWTFARSGTTWLLSRIDQHTAAHYTTNSSLMALAHDNGMFYSLDMGWLLIPQRGIIIGGGTFGRSDINNHIIGLYQQRLFQIYTYRPTIKRVDANWLIVQLNLPKSYDGIIVQKNTGFMSFGSSFIKPPSNYTKYTYEWPEFNKRYSVYATNRDRLAAFELINPGFMAYLYDNDPSVGIEVVDNTLYLFKSLTSQGAATPQQAYTTMFDIALKAFKELRL